MEIITGRSTQRIDHHTLMMRVAGRTVGIDLGTGDGRYVLHRARAQPTRFWIGVDACRENLRDHARRAPGNVLYVIANALALPSELHGLAAEITINFPWGSLLGGLVDGALLPSLRTAAQPGATLELRLNAGALEEQGVSLADGGGLVSQALRRGGFALEGYGELGPIDLRALASSWGRRLAVGRDPRAVLLRAVFVPAQLQLTDVDGEPWLTAA